jgi:hypothetical protein
MACPDQYKISAIAFLNECYDYLCPKEVEKYLVVVGELKREVDR